MSQTQSIRSGLCRRGRWIFGNPLWPLEELRNLRNPAFVADPEFASLNIEALGRKRQSALTSPNDPKQPRSSKYLCQHGIPLPRLVAGLPWRYSREAEDPVVPETDFVPLNLSRISA